MTNHERWGPEVISLPINPAGAPKNAAKSTTSHELAGVSETLQLAHSENVAAAAGSVLDIHRASQLVKALAHQISDQPAAAKSAQAHVDPKSALSLLS